MSCLTRISTLLREPSGPPISQVYWTKLSNLSPVQYVALKLAKYGRAEHAPAVSYVLAETAASATVDGPITHAPTATAIQTMRSLLTPVIRSPRLRSSDQTTRKRWSQHHLLRRRWVGVSWGVINVATRRLPASCTSITKFSIAWMTNPRSA